MTTIPAHYHPHHWEQPKGIRYRHRVGTHRSRRVEVKIMGTDHPLYGVLWEAVIGTGGRSVTIPVSDLRKLQQDCAAALDELEELSGIDGTIAL